MQRVLLVPSCGIKQKDELDSNTRQRCGSAHRLWKTGQFEKIVVCGGTFMPPKTQTRPASEIMRDWFRENCPEIPYDALIVESRSLDTYENLAFAMRLLGPDDEITVVTQFQHGIRFLMTGFLAHGRRIKIHAVHQPDMHVSDWILEWMFLIPYHLLDWHGTWFIAKRNRKQRHNRTTRA